MVVGENNSPAIVPEPTEKFQDMQQWVHRFVLSKLKYAYK